MKFKKILSMVISLSMLLSMVVGNQVVFAASAATDFTYQSMLPVSDTYWISGYTGSSSVVAIPATYNGKSVTGINLGAFKSSMNITSLTIPGSVTDIIAGTFSGFTSLTTVTLSSGLKSIGDSAFSGCTNLTSITIPGSVTTIGQNAFDSCTSLASATILNGLTSIANRTFTGCSSLATVSIPTSVTSIGIGAFGDCSKLNNVTIPSSVKTLGNVAFQNCISLTSITIPGSVTLDSNSAFSDGLFEGCTSLANVTISNGVPVIGDNDFKGCSNLTNISIPNSVTSIGKNAFQDCSSLPSIAIPSSVKTIGQYAFYNCTSLMAVWSYASTPPNGSGFINIPDSSVLHVPVGATTAYNSAGWNSLFGSMVEIISTTKAPVLTKAPVVTVGSIQGSTKITLTPNKIGDTFQYVKAASPLGSVPGVGDGLPSGATAYTSGSNITGVDAATNKYIDIYEVDSSANVVAFSEITLTAGNIAISSLTIAPTAAPGTKPGSTKLTLVSNKSGDTYKVVVTAVKLAAMPIAGVVAPGTAYISGNDLTGVEPATNKYVDVYEIDSTGKVVAFSEVTLVNENVTAPTSKVAPVVAGGTVQGSTKITIAANRVGDTFKYLVASSPLGSIPVMGTALPDGTTAYTSGSNITGVDAVTNKYIDIYEVDVNSKIVAFNEITLTAANITSPSLTIAPTAAPGTKAGSTKLTLVSNKSGDTYKVVVAAVKLATVPVTGAVAPGTAYTTGSDLTGVEPATNKYVDVYEVDGAGKVVAFSEVTLVNENVTAPISKAAPVVAGGTVQGSTKITIGANRVGDTFKYLVASSPLGSIPVIGTSLPDGTTAYTSGSNITGVDAVTNKYIDIYEVDVNAKIVAFNEITLTAANITSPSLNVAPTAAPGTKAGSTKLTLVSNKSGDTYKVVVAAAKLAIVPVTGSVAPGTAYVSGNDITGVDGGTTKYVDVYETDSTGKVVAFTEVTLTNDNITAPTSKAAPVVAGGTVQGTTKITIAANKAGDIFQYVNASSPLGSIPVVGTALPSGTKAYISGSNITGVDAATNKYIDIYEVDANSKIVAFNEITLTAANITSPSLTIAPTAAPGAKAGSTKLTLVSNKSGDTYKVVVAAAKLAIVPVTGSVAPGTAYVSGNDITGVDGGTTKYVDVYETDSTGKVVAFTEVTLINDNVTAPTSKAVPVVAGGTVQGTTKITITANKAGDNFKYLLASSPLGSIPVTGSSLPDGTAAYTSGSNIAGIDAVTNKYIDIYEVDANSKIVAFNEITLTASNITSPSLTIAPTAAPGAKAGSTKLTLVSNKSGDTYKVVVAAVKLAIVPVTGSVAPGTAYVSGNDITGVDGGTTKYVDVYETDSTGKVVAFTEVTLINDNVTAPTSKTVPVVAAGTVVGTTKITIAANKVGDTFQYVNVSSPLGAIPVVGTALPSGTTAYTSGSNIAGVDAVTNKYIDIYEVDASSKIVAFNEITLVASNIKAATTGTTGGTNSVTVLNVTVSPGSVGGTIKLNATPDVSSDGPPDKIMYKISSSLISGVTTATDTSSYTNYFNIGSDITGIDATTNKYIGVAETSLLGKVIKFKCLTLTTSDINCDTLGAWISTGVMPGTVKVVTGDIATGYKYKVSNQPIPTPTAADIAAWKDYTPLTDIYGVDATTNKYLTVAKADGGGGVPKFTPFVVTAADITPADNDVTRDVTFRATYLAPYPHDDSMFSDGTAKSVSTFITYSEKYFTNDYLNGKPIPTFKVYKDAGHTILNSSVTASFVELGGSYSDYDRTHNGTLTLSSANAIPLGYYYVTCTDGILGHTESNTFKLIVGNKSAKPAFVGAVGDAVTVSASDHVLTTTNITGGKWFVEGDPNNYLSAQASVLDGPNTVHIYGQNIVPGTTTFKIRWQDDNAGVPSDPITVTVTP